MLINKKRILIRVPLAIAKFSEKLFEIMPTPIFRRDELNLLSTNLNQKKCEILTQENIINKRNRELKKKEKEFNIQLKKQFKKTNINQ